MSTVAELLAEIEAFRLDQGMAETTFGRHAVNDGKFVGRLRNGAGVTVATVDRVKAYMATVRGEPVEDDAAATSAAASERASAS